MPRLSPLFSLGLLACTPALTRADDLAPPPWRAGPLATFQDWDFSAGPDGGAPDVAFANPIGAPFIIPTSPIAWLATSHGRDEVWTLSPTGGIDAIVPHDVDLSRPADLWIQVTYWSDSPAPLAPAFSITSSFDTALLADVATTTLADGWRHEVSRWTIDRAASYHELRFRSPGAPAFIDDLIIDVRTVPAPAASAALAAGLAAGAIRRRR